jgi:hypothetical protein
MDGQIIRSFINQWLAMLGGVPPPKGVYLNRIERIARKALLVKQVSIKIRARI